jgi:hypothetical protein
MHLWFLLVMVVQPTKCNINTSTTGVPGLAGVGWLESEKWDNFVCEGPHEVPLTQAMYESDDTFLMASATCIKPHEFAAYNKHMNFAMNFAWFGNVKYIGASAFRGFGTTFKQSGASMTFPNVEFIGVSCDSPTSPHSTLRANFLRTSLSVGCLRANRPSTLDSPNSYLVFSLSTPHTAYLSKPQLHRRMLLADHLLVGRCRSTRNR